MNVVNLIGRLTRDPELRYSPSGVGVTRITVAVDRKLSRDKKQEAQANNQPTADFISCVAFNKTAELIANYFNKGSKIGVEGKIQTGSYEKPDGTRVYTTDVFITGITFIGSSGGNNNSGNYQNSNSQENYYPVENSDDIPF